ncbi:toll/interleukin-1 receptor domain-containing protein [Bacillus shivajii]|uniref:toll/interleukin-1 receptor domain-containing protein n=1 Tax=Bacillus shivajii TaxID=1983719 RepID=UPI001CFB8907|nr:toll/interleukin-1 receptor domain-containing protein [Bacillus shivajii]UCZ52905.1 toll/interleukin-1 receptor domain-containing protein [Bacillus shivajii]
MSEQRQPIFLSHASADINVIKQIANYLEERNIPCWYAPRNIPKGDQYYIRIEEDIENIVSAMVVIITSNSKYSTYVPKEIIAAQSYNKLIIPVLMDSVTLPQNVRFLLRDSQWLDMEEEGLEVLCDALEENYQGERNNHFLSKQRVVNEPVVLPNEDEVKLYRINNDILNKVSSVYVPSIPQDDVLEKLRLHQFVFLHHPHHTGKYTTAMALLEEMGKEEVYEYSQDIHFREVINLPVKPNIGLILEMDNSQIISQFSHDHFQEFLQKLKDKNAHLVIISKEETSISSWKMISAKVKGPTNTKKLIQNHAKWNAFGEDLRTSLAKWLQTNEANQVLPNIMYPREVNELLIKIKALLLNEINFDHFVNSLDVNIELRVKGWFDNQTSLYDKAFYLCIAVFQGEPFPYVVKKAEELHHYFLHHFGQGLTDIPNTPRDQYLSSFHAYSSTKIVQTDLGSEEIQGCVYFSFPDDGLYAWEYVWTQFSSYQTPLLSWMKQNITETKKVDSFATILARLLKTDLRTIRSSVIQPMAKSNKNKERLFVVQVLDDLNSKDELKQTIWNLCKSWMGSGQRNLQWTALFLIGGKLGYHYFPESLKLALSVVQSDTKSLFHQAKISISKISHIVHLGEKYERLYFSIWQQTFAEAEQEKLSVLLRFAQGVFMSDEKLFFHTSDEFIKEFWSPFLNALYEYPTNHLLLDKWMRYANGNRAYEDKLLLLIRLIFQRGSVDSKDRLRMYIEQHHEESDIPQYLTLQLID